MQDNTVDLKPKTFAITPLENEDRPAFLARVREAGLDPDVTFAKNTSLVKTSNFRMTFKSGMVLVGDLDALDSKVELPDDKEPGDPVQLHDSVERLLTGR